MSAEDRPVEKAATPPSVATPVATSTRKRPSWLPVAVLLGVFLLGFLPSWYQSYRLRGDLFHARQEARVQTLQLTLADAALDARQGEYEPARRSLANFFTLLTAELDRGIGSALPPDAGEKLKPLLAQRDDLITLLARGDQASAERLATAYAEFRKSLGK